MSAAPCRFPGCVSLVTGAATACPVHLGDARGKRCDACSGYGLLGKAPCPRCGGTGLLDQHTGYARPERTPVDDRPIFQITNPKEAP